jgi:hypothetical protein
LLLVLVLREFRQAQQTRLTPRALDDCLPLRIVLRQALLQLLPIPAAPAPAPASASKWLVRKEHNYKPAQHQPKV